MNKEHGSALNIPYVRHEDYCFPNFTLSSDVGDISFWGRRRKEYLREHRSILFNQLMLSGEPFTHLTQLNQEAAKRLEVLIHSMKVTQEITEELQARNQMS